MHAGKIGTAAHFAPFFLCDVRYKGGVYTPGKGASWPPSLPCGAFWVLHPLSPRFYSIPGVREACPRRKGGILASSPALVGHLIEQYFVGGTTKQAA